MILSPFNCSWRPSGHSTHPRFTTFCRSSHSRCRSMEVHTSPGQQAHRFPNQHNDAVSTKIHLFDRPAGSPRTNLLDDDRPPFPAATSHPAYPADSLAEGVVILGLRIGSNGTVDDLQVIRDVPPLVGPSEQAVRSWTFSPAMARGQPVPGTAIIAISFLRPVVATGP